MTGAASQVVEALVARGLTLATAESLTAGLVSARVADVPGASRVLRGGAVTYATDAKASILGVDPALLEERGAVDAEVAEQMARGVRRLFGADIAVATTGVAGPSEQDGQAVGTVFVGVAFAERDGGLRGGGGDAGESSGSPVRCHHRRFYFDGDRASIRAAACEAALALVLDLV